MELIFPPIHIRRNHNFETTDDAQQKAISAFFVLMKENHKKRNTEKTTLMHKTAIFQDFSIPEYLTPIKVYEEITAFPDRVSDENTAAEVGCQGRGTSSYVICT